MAYSPGVNDISGQLIGQGIASLGAGISQGVERQQKEKNILQEASGRGRALAQTFKGLEQLGLVPEGQVDQIRQAQESMSPREFMGFADNLGQNLGAIMQGGMQMRQVEAAKAKQDAERARQAALSQAMSAMAGAPDLATAQKIALQSGMDPGDVSSLINAAANVQKTMAPEQAKNPVIHTVPETGPNGEAFTVTYQFLPDGTRKELGRQRTDVQPGYSPAPNGGMVPIPGGPAAQKMSEKAAEDQKAIDRANALKADIAGAVGTVNEAISLIRDTGAGGTFEGLPGVRGALAAVGRTAPKVLNSKYDTLRAVLKLEKLKEMKDLSKTGASGLGQLSDKEGVALESSVASLDPSLPENEQRANLLKIKDYLMRLGGVPAPMQVGRFKIIPQP